MHTYSRSVKIAKHIEPHFSVGFKGGEHKLYKRYNENMCKYELHKIYFPF